MKRDPNYVAAVEKAIREKYGELTVINPKSLWDTEKEAQYIQELKDSHKKDVKEEKIELDGVFISKKLINSKLNRNCKFCDTYSFNRDNEVYLTKYSCCQKCYILNIEGR